MTQTDDLRALAMSVVYTEDRMRGCRVDDETLEQRVYEALRAAVEAERAEVERLRADRRGRCACRFNENDEPINQCDWHKLHIRAAVEAEREACEEIAERWGDIDVRDAIRARRTDNG